MQIFKNFFGIFIKFFNNKYIKTLYILNNKFIFSLKNRANYKLDPTDLFLNLHDKATIIQFYIFFFKYINDNI